MTVADSLRIEDPGQSKDLVFFFSGMAPERFPPPYEFVSSTTGLSACRVYVRDLHQIWYQEGISGLSSDVDGSVESLRQLLRERGGGRTIACGNSMGGYAALLFGYLLGLDEVHVFSPKTFVTPWKRIVHGDVWIKHWLKTGDSFMMRRLWRLQAGRGFNRRYFDLKPMLQVANQHSKYHIYFASGNRVDRLHSRRLTDIEEVIMHPYEYGRHNLIQHLHKRGELEKIFQEIVAGRQAIESR